VLVPRPAFLAPVVATALLVGSPAGSSQSRDESAAKTYVHAVAALTRTLTHNMPSGEQALDAILLNVERQCPGALAAAPTGEQADSMEQRIIWATVIVEATPSRSAMRSYAQTLSRLRWSNRRLTRMVHQQASKEMQLLSLRAPKLCATARSWAASGFQELPAVSRRYQRILGPRIVAVRLPGIPELLEPYESSGLRSLMKRAEGLKRRTALRLDSAWTKTTYKLIVSLKLADALGKGEAPALPRPKQIPAPEAVRQAGGQELHEFVRGRKVAEVAGCEACHRIGESGNDGPGPTLTHVGSKLTEAQIRRVLLHPRAPMPSFKNLPRGKMRALVRFLALLK
jgi:mono/diheme cytochrome c family protein